MDKPHSRLKRFSCLKSKEIVIKVLRRWLPFGSEKEADVMPTMLYSLCEQEKVPGEDLLLRVSMGFKDVEELVSRDTSYFCF